MMDIAARDLAMLGARIETIPGRMGFGDCVRARFPHPKGDAPGILVMGHMDTVHPVGTLDALPVAPGRHQMLRARHLRHEGRQLDRRSRRSASCMRAGIATPLPVTVLFTSDEEVGSPSTRDLIEAEAARHRYVLVPEPCRHGRRRGDRALRHRALQPRTVGRPSHAGARLADGRTAIREMARRSSRSRR